MASGSQNMTTYNARTVTGSSSAASPAGALLLSGAGRADDATGDTWIFLDSHGGTSAPWGIKHDQANNKIHIYGNNTDSVWTRMDTGDTYILGKVGIGYDPETSGNTYKLYVNGSSFFNDHIYLVADKEFYMQYDNTMYDVLHNHNNGNISVNAASAGLYMAYYNTTFVNWMNGRMELRDGCLSLFPNNNAYRDGMRIHMFNSWSTITLCGADNTGNSGTSANSWFIGNNNGNFYITRNGSNNDGSAHLRCVNNVWAWNGTATGNINGNATTCTYPLGFSSRSTGVTWGNTTGTTITAWNDSAGGSCDWRMNNPSSGKMSLKVDGRFYGNEGTYPAMLMRNENSFWGLCDPDAANNVWIRTTTQGIIPFQSGGRGSGHCGLGTSSWYFSYAYVDTYYANRYSTSHGYINGAATNGGINMILAGDDVWLGDCNAGGILGLKAANSTNCGLYMYNNSGTQIGQFYSANGSYFYSSKCFYAPNTGSSWIDGQRYQRAALNIHTINNTGSYFPWVNQINDGSSRWFSFGILNNSFYMIGSAKSRTANGYDHGLCFDVSTGYLTGCARVYNAIWNDYAEFRVTESEEPGRLVVPSNDGIAHLSTERLQPGGRIISDTYGHAVGQSDQAKTPIGLAGRVLVYPYRNKNEYKIGDAVCSAPGGTIDIMTRDEIMTYPDRIVGIVNEIPDYEVWEQTFSEQGGGGQTTQKIEVKGRIWIDIK